MEEAANESEEEGRKIAYMRCHVACSSIPHIFHKPIVDSRDDQIQIQFLGQDQFIGDAGFFLLHHLMGHIMFYPTFSDM